MNRALANFLLSAKRTAEAEPYLVALTKVDPSPGARLTLADYYVATGRADEAIPLLKSIGRQRARAVGRSAHSAGDDRCPRKAVCRCRTRRRRSAERERQRHRGAPAESHDPARTRKDRRGCQATSKPQPRPIPRSARAQFALGKLALLQRRPDDAKRAFTETLRLNPRAADAQTELARVHLAQGAIDTGVDLAGQAVKNDPSSVEARLVLARGFVAKKDLARAQEILTELTLAHPKSAEARTQLGFVLALRGDRAGAARAFDEALALDPNYLDATAGLSAWISSARNFDGARSRVAARVQRTPSDSDALLLAGKTYAAVGDAKNAEDSMRKALELDPGNLAAYEALGRLFVQANRLPEALQEFEALAARQRRPSRRSRWSGCFRKVMKRTVEARTAYEKALEYRPTCRRRGQQPRVDLCEPPARTSTSHCNSPRPRRPDFPAKSEVADTLGWIYHRKGLNTLAIRELQEAVDRDPDNPTYHYHLGSRMRRTAIAIWRSGRWKRPASQTGFRWRSGREPPADYVVTSRLFHRIAGRTRVLADPFHRRSARRTQAVRTLGYSWSCIFSGVFARSRVLLSVMGLYIMRVLLLSQRLPYAPNRGDRVRVYHMLREVARHAEIDVASLVHDEEEESHASDLRGIAAEVITARVPRLRNVTRGGAALLGSTPLTHVLLDSPLLAPALEALIRRRRPDVLLTFCSSMARFALQPPLSSLPCVLDMIDADSAKWTALANTSRPPLRWVYRREAGNWADSKRLPCASSIRRWL